MKISEFIFGIIYILGMIFLMAYLDAKEVPLILDFIFILLYFFLYLLLCSLYYGPKIKAANEKAEKERQIKEQIKKQEEKKHLEYLEREKKRREQEAYERWLEERKRQQQIGMLEIDRMDGYQFERYCANLLRKTGFSSVEVTKGSGDQGVDIIATKDGIRYAIQCKRYSSPLGNSPVQEVNAGKYLYHCQVAVVLTNQHFTSGAKQLAAATGVLLWDREKLEDMVKRAKYAL